MMPHFKLSLTSAAIAACLLAACGGDSSGGSAAASATSTPVPTPTLAPGATGAPTPTPVVAPLGSGVPLADPAQAGVTHHYFKITVKDAADGTLIAGAALTTTANEVFTSDNNGVIAFYEPGLMGTDVWFSIRRNGYDVTADGLGMKGVKLHPLESGSASVSLNKTGAPASINAGTLQTRLAAGNVPGAAQCLALRVFDKQNNRGVPLVTLANANGSYITDSQGMVAYCDPDHMGAQDFAVSTYGYTLSGGTAHVNAVGGQLVQIGLDRQNIAERLYRTTGQGIYRDSSLLGLITPLRNPNLNAQVTGQDSVITALYKGKIFWTWGDSNNSAYALGQFSTSGAVSDLPVNGGLSPDLGLDQTYYASNGFSKKMVEDMPGNSPIWVGALVALPDAQGAEHLFSGFVKVEQTDSNGTTPARHGLLKFDDTDHTFKQVIADYGSSKAYPGGGEAIRFSNGDQEYAYFGSTLRIPAKAEAIVDQSTYQVFTAYKADGSGQLQQSGTTLNYAWTGGGQVGPVTPANVSAAGLDASQALDGHLREATTGASMSPAAPSITWNAYRHRFVMVANQQYALGDVIYAEADTPMGPWVDARKIITHPGYTFYNPYMHPYLSPDNGHTMYLEGSYTMTFSSATVATPFYNYNQIMYRLNADDPALIMPVAIYDLGSSLPGHFVSKTGLPANSGPVAAVFRAPDRQASGTLPFGFTGNSCSSGQRLALGAAVARPMFYALPASGTHPVNTVPLYEFVNNAGQYAYALASSLSGYTRSANPVAYVWTSPIQVKLPVKDYQTESPPC